jgi:hypothetical protein
VYEIDSEFQGMVRAEKLRRENIDKMVQKLKFTRTQAAKVELKKLEEEAQLLV